MSSSAITSPTPALASDPAQAQGKERTARQLLEDGALRVETELKDQPEVQSEVSRLIGRVYHDLGEYERAEPLLHADLDRRRKLDGPRSVPVAESLAALGDVRYEQARFDEAGAMYEEALSIEREKRGDRSPQVAQLLSGLAAVSRGRGDLARAEELERRSLALYVETKGDDSLEATEVRDSLATTLAQRSHLGEAAAMAGTVANWHEGHDGPDHPPLGGTEGERTLLLGRGRLRERLAHTAHEDERQCEPQCR